MKLTPTYHPQIKRFNFKYNSSENNVVADTHTRPMTCWRQLVRAKCDNPLLCGVLGRHGWAISQLLHPDLHLTTHSDGVSMSRSQFNVIFI